MNLEPTQEDLDKMTTAEASAHIMACEKELHKCNVCTYIKAVLGTFKDKKLTFKSEKL